MRGTATDRSAWKRMVLQAMAPPAWLREAGPCRDIVLSTRVRYMRNLRGHRFPHTAAPYELQEILSLLKSAASASPHWEALTRPSPAERDYLVACRLVSPDFEWDSPGRAVFLTPDRAVCTMANEEDHLRVQALTGGWSLPQALGLADHALASLSQQAEFAWSSEFGYLAASPSNCGAGLRYSAMFHLIGLAHTRRLADVIRALNSQGIVVRGLFGERSRAIGAFTQVSSTAGAVPQFVGACEYLLEQEARARAGVPDSELHRKRSETETFVESRQSLTLSDALRVLAWRRWPPSDRRSLPLTVDAILPELALLDSLGEPRAGQARAQLFRENRPEP
jgi:protein arginine kinase